MEIEPAPMGEVAQAMPPARRFRWRRTVGLIAGLVLCALVVSGLYLDNVYMPLTEGSFVGPDIDTPGSLFVADVSNPMDQGALWTWCFTPGRTFAWHVSLRNEGPLPVTILGSGSGSPSVFVQTDFAVAREVLPDTTPTDTHEIIENSATAPVLPPTTLAPNDELELWARFRMGDEPEGSDTTAWKQSLSVRYSVLGLERMVDVPFRDGVGIDGAPCPPRSWP